MKWFISNQLNKSIYFAIVEAEKCGENTIGLDFLLLGLLREKNSLAFRIFKKTYKDHEKVLKNLKSLIYDFHKTKTYKMQDSNQSEISFTPALENLLFRLSIINNKNNSVLTTKDIFFLLLSNKRLAQYLKKSNIKG